MLRVIIYLDDLLLLHSDFLETQLLTNLRFLIKEKCSAATVQSLVFLGALISSLIMTLVVPLTKLQKLLCEVQALKIRKMYAIQ